MHVHGPLRIDIDEYTHTLAPLTELVRPSIKVDVADLSMASRPIEFMLPEESRIKMTFFGPLEPDRNQARKRGSYSLSH